MKVLGKILREIFFPMPKVASHQQTRPRVLNVGGGNKDIPIPAHYDGWEHLLLDVDSRGNPDIICDARKLDSLDAGQFDAVYCSHNLEHYYRHDGIKVLRGMRHILKDDGFVEIRVPDLRSVIERMVCDKLDLADVLYQSPMGPIAVLDVIYGYAREIEESGKDFYAHKTGFTPKLLRETLQTAEFAAIYVTAVPENFEAQAIAFKSLPSPAHQQLLGISNIANWHGASINER